MEEAPKTRRYPLLVALAGVILLAAIWATMALAGGSSPAAKPAAKAPAAKTQAAKAQHGHAGISGGHDCPFKDQGRRRTTSDRRGPASAGLRSPLARQRRRDRRGRPAQLSVGRRHVAGERLAGPGGVVADRVRERSARHLADEPAAGTSTVAVADDRRSRDPRSRATWRPGRRRPRRRVATRARATPRRRSAAG